MKGRTHASHLTILTFVVLSFVFSNARTQDLLTAGSAIISHLSADYGLAGDEFVVLYNPTSDTIDLNGHELRYFTASGSVGSAGRSFTGPVLIPPGRHRLVSSNDTVIVGTVAVLRDGPFTSGMATTGGQLVLRSSSVPDSVVFAAAWGTVTSYVAGMSDAASWAGDGMLALVWDGVAYARSSHVFSNAEYVHIPADSIHSVPSLAGAVTLMSDAAWSIPVSFAQGSHGNPYLMLGLDPDATDGFDTSFDVPRPPPPAVISVVAGVYRPDLGLATGEHLLRDIRSMRALADTAVGWFIDVDPAESGTMLSIALDLSALPAGLPVQMRDLASGARAQRDGDSLWLGLVPATTDPLRLLVLVGDSTPPAVGFLQPVGGEHAVVGNTMVIGLSIEESSGVDSLSLSFVDAQGALTVAVLDTTAEVSSLSWVLPERLLTDNAFFRLFVRDSLGNAAVYQSASFAVVPDTQRTALGPGWHLFSLPLESANEVPLFSAADSVFAFGYGPGGGYQKADSLEPGRGYFVGLMSPKTFTLVGIPVVDSFSVPLQQGFVLIGHPGPATVARDALSFASGGTTHAYAPAVAAGFIGGGFFAYDNASGMYISADSLRPWESYWIPVLAEDVAVSFPPSTAQGSSRVIAGQMSGWEVALIASTGSAADSLFSFGVHPDASDGFDRFDVASPPSPPGGSPVRIFAERPEWGSIVGPRFLRDIRRDGSLHVWRFGVAVRGEQTVTLRRKNDTGIVPEGLLIREMTAGGGEWEDFEEHWTYAWTGGGSKEFEVRTTTTGVREGTFVPSEFGVSQNYPNPFNGMTAVTIGVPERGHVGAAIYDLLGRAVGAYAEREYSPGRHVLTWRVDLSSGVYIGELLFRSAANRAVRSKIRWRMVLMK